MNDVIVVSKDSFDSEIEFKFTHEDGTTTTRKVNAALSTLLHEVTHFAEGTKEYLDIVKFVSKHVNDAEIAEILALYQTSAKAYKDGLERLEENGILDKDDSAQYNKKGYAKKKFSFHHGNFPTYDESGSEANRLAIWWASKNDVVAGDKALVSMNDRWYIVEKFDDADNGYQVEDRITLAQYNKYYEEIKKYGRAGRNGRIKSVQTRTDRLDSINKSSSSIIDGKSSININTNKYGIQSDEIQRMDKVEVDRGERFGRNRNANNAPSSSNRSFLDSEGNLLSFEQAKYFANSKVRDDKSNLLVVYHQTDADFTVFDTHKKGAGHSDYEMPHGIFLKPTSENIGLKGDKQMSLYAKIENPLVFHNREQAQRYWKQNIEGYDALVRKIAENDKKYNELFEEAFSEKRLARRKGLEFADLTEEQQDKIIEESSRKCDEILKEWRAENEKVDIEAKSLIDNYLKKSGYDGLHLFEDRGSFGRKIETWVAINSNQVKNIENKAPTENPDIRYSVKNNINQNAYASDYARYAGDEYVGISEVTATVMEKLLSDEGYIKRLCQDNRTLGKRILNKIRNMWERLKGESKEEKELRAVLKQAEKLYNDAIAHAPDREKKSIENSLTKDGDIAYSTIDDSDKQSDYTLTIAPYYSTNINNENFTETQKKAHEIFFSNATQFSKALNIDLELPNDCVGGYSFEAEGNVESVVELSYAYMAKNITQEQAELFTCLMSDLGQEVQDTGIVSTYCTEEEAKNNPDSTALQIEIPIKPLGNDVETLPAILRGEKVGISDFTIDYTDNVIRLYERVDITREELKEFIGTIIDGIGEYYDNGRVDGLQSRYTSSEFLTASDRRSTYRTWLEKRSTAVRQSGADLHDYIVCANEVAGEYADAKAEGKNRK